MGGYLIYHPRRQTTAFGNTVVYHDDNRGNQDPYVWNRQFLHTYCHITQMSPAIGDLNFWVGGNTFPYFTALYCDLVFVVEQKVYWAQSDIIDPEDALVDSAEAFVDHYQWARYQHPLKRRRRFTLKADPGRSFQPQDADRHLLDILPFLIEAGFSLPDLQNRLQARVGSKPLRLDGGIAEALHHWLDRSASLKLTGILLQEIRRQNPQLASRRSP